MAIDPHGTVLVVDDDDSMREAIERLLEAAGFASVGYPSAEALLAGGGMGNARCIISDVRLPAMSGLALVTELRRLGVLTPVIIITAHDSPVARNDAKLHGAAAYLAKPFMSKALLAALVTSR
jgi:two-component system response regulator FixJ